MLQNTSNQLNACVISKSIFFQKSVHNSPLVEMATAQRTRPRAVVGAPRRAAWQPKSVLRHSVSVAPRTIIFYIFLQLLQVNYFVMSNNGRS